MTTTTLPSRWNGVLDLDGAPQAPRTLFGRLRANLDRCQRVRKIALELERLSDRDLDDIGIRRADIWYIARSSV